MKKNKNHKKATLVIYDTYIDLLIKNQTESNSLKEIIKQFKNETNKEIKDRIISIQIIPYFEKFINKMIYKYKTFDSDDLKQIAYYSIIKALNNYQESDQDPTSYFLCYIEKEIKNYIMNQDILKIPKTVRKLYHQIQKYILLNPSATIKEISEKFNLTENAVQEILSIPQKNNIDLTSIKSKKIKDLELPIEEKIFLEQIISKLSEIEKKIIHFILYEDITKTNLAKKLNISRKHLYTLIEKIKSFINKWNL